MDDFVTAEPFPPGEYIQEELDARGWKQEDLAQVLGMTQRQIANLLSGKSALTPGTAIALGEAFGQNAKVWMDLQIAYELAMAAQSDRDVARRAAIFHKVPVREMKKRCWLPDTDDTEELERAVCDFLRVDRIEDEPSFAIVARKSTGYGYETSAQVAWYMRCRQLAEHVSAASFSMSGLESSMPELLRLAANPEDARVVPKVLADIGVRLVLNQHLSKTKIEGAAFWLDDSSPAIALSLRYDRIDNFWFNIIHELIHIQHRHASTIDIEATSESGELPEAEIVANREAADRLIPAGKMESFIKRVRPLYYQKRIVQFARAQGVHPGIVVGQLHRRGELKPSQLRKLLVPIRDYVIGQTITDGWGNDLCLA